MNDYGQYVSPSTGQLSQDLINHAAYSTDDVFTDWLDPSQKEERQMGQQLIMDLVEPSTRMQGLKDAGINPLTAAAGIAGTAPNSPQPASSTNPIGDVVGAVSSLADSATGGMSNVANALFQLGTKNPTIAKLQNEADEMFERIGLTKAEATIAKASAEYADENALRDIQVKRLNVKTLSQQYKNYKAVHEQIMEDIELKIAQAKLAGSQEEYYKQLKLKTQEETRWIKEDNDFWERNGYDRNSSSEHNIIANLIANGQDPDEFIDAWIGYAKKYANAQESAKAEESWNARPSNPTEAAFTVVNEVEDVLKTAAASSRSGAELREKAKKDAAAQREFEEAYWSYKHDLYEIYRSKKREYNRIKHGNRQAAAQAQMAMNNARNDYVNCNRETFSDMLVSRLGNPASTPVEE